MFPNKPWTDGQLHPPGGTTAGIQRRYDAAKQRWSIHRLDVVGTQNTSSKITSDRLDIAAIFDVSTPPAHAAGRVYVVGPGPTGAWAGHANDLAFDDGSSYRFVTPYEGMIVWDLTYKTLRGWTGTEWASPAITSATNIPPDSINSAAIQAGAVTPDKLNLKVVTRSLSTAIGTATIGQMYIVKPTPPAGDPWFGQAGKLAIKTSTGNTAASWTFTQLASGKLYWIDDERALFGYSGSELKKIGPPGSGELSATQLDDLADLVEAQAISIVNAIDASTGTNGALARLKAALGGFASGGSGTATVTTATASASVPAGGRANVNTSLVVPSAGKYFAVNITGGTLVNTANVAALALYDYTNNQVLVPSTGLIRSGPVSFDVYTHGFQSNTPIVVVFVNDGSNVGATCTANVEMIVFN